MITNKKIFNFVSSITIFLSAFSIPLSAFAVTSTFTDTTQIQQQATALSTSGTTAQGNTTPSANTYTGAAAGGIATAAGSCSIGTLASQMLVSTVSKAIGSLTGAAKNAVSSAVSSKVNSVITTSVPVLMVGDPASHIANQDKNTAALAQKSFSSSATTGGTFDGITNSVTDAFSFPSLDAIGFCVANEMIKYIANSTIQWI
ncbi:MAG: hypothetical protein WCO18_02790, partial [bacterium]